MADASPSDLEPRSIRGPVRHDSTPFVGASSLDLESVGYVVEEYFLSGSATAFDAAGPLGEDGRWNATRHDAAEYTTRIVVRRPTDPDRFNGTVALEWLNVSGGLDADPGWTYLHNEFLRSGVAWVGVSAQHDGVEGGGDALGGALALKNANTERYGELHHPGDDYSYDIFSQAAAAIRSSYDDLLGGLRPQTLLAIGQSQSAFRLTTYINAVAPLLELFDGYFVHSRAGFGAELRVGLDAPIPTRSRTDLEAPVMVLSTETDLPGTRLGYARARQDDSAWFVAWEAAGTAHVDSYGLGIGDADHGGYSSDKDLFTTMIEPPASVYFGVIECDCPINSGPHTYVARAAFAALERWARDGEVPPSQPRLVLTDDGEDLVRDADGNAIGGIRMPQVDVPVATLSGLGQDSDSFCGLFGTTVPFGEDELTRRYERAEFVDAWDASIRSALDRGVLLAPDAQRLRDVARGSSIGR